MSEGGIVRGDLCGRLVAIITKHVSSDDLFLQLSSNGSTYISLCAKDQCFFSYLLLVRYQNCIPVRWYLQLFPSTMLA